MRFLNIFTSWRNSSELLILWTSVYFVSVCNFPFWSAWGSGRDFSSPATWALGASLFVGLLALHCTLLGVLLFRQVTRPVLTLLLLLAALSSFYMLRYTVYLDTGMLRNILHTDFKEARELWSGAMLGWVAGFGLLPAIFLWRLPLAARTLRSAMLGRLLFLFCSMLALLLCFGFAYRDLSALLRNHKEVRYLVTPANAVVSALRVAFAETSNAAAPRIPVGQDAKLAPAWTGRSKPLLLVIVVGETARAANWGLNGYERETTPELRALPGLLSFTNVTSCGTNTEVSLPCMFSRVGRIDYDEKRIRREESLLHVLNHAGIKTLWRDNQSGCKGVCTGLETEAMSDLGPARDCERGVCLDEILLQNLEGELQKRPQGMVLVLHQLGNHGPAYSRRHPPSFRRFTPTCDSPDLGKCSREQIVNSYDNALLYTDHFLAEAVRRLQAQQTHDAALLYVSDHGESLGERGIYLHGLPWAIAPQEQTAVPMALWASPQFAAASKLDIECVRKRSAASISHDYLFSSVLALMQVETSTYQPALDFTAGCRTPQKP